MHPRALFRATALAAALAASTATAAPSPAVTPATWPKARSPAALMDAQTEVFIDGLIAKMTLEEKVGQVVQADITAIKPEDLLTYPLGSILAGGNSAPGGDERAPAQAWVDLARAYRAANDRRPGTKIPLIFGVDAVHGHNNVVGATIFPHNVGLGAARDPDLIRRIGAATAVEAAVTGVDWTFGPTVAVPRDDRWGRSYEGYSENPEIVAAYAKAVTLGLQGELRRGQPLAPDRIVGSAKHFLADGGTDGGRDQGDATISEQELIGVHAAGYPPTIDAGVLTVMASFSSWNGQKVLANSGLLTDVLRGPLGFTGFTVGDWNAHGQVPGCSNESCPTAFNAGLDMFMAPDSWRGLYVNTLKQVRAGEISQTRLDEAVRRILRVKAKAGLFDRQRPLEGRLELLGSPEHRALAREAVRKSLVLLKNNGGVLPIRPGAKILVAGAAADDIGQAAGGWTLTWQGTGNTNRDFPHGQSIWAGIAEAAKASGGRAQLSPDGSFTEKPDVAIVVFGETPYAEFQGDLETVDFAPEEPLALLRRLKAQGVPVVSVFLSGRPLWTNPEINASDAFVAAWLPGSEGGGVADLLLAGPSGAPRYDFTGRLAYSWPKSAAQSPLNVGQPGYAPQFAYGFGLSYAKGAQTPALPEDPGVTPNTANPDRYLGPSGAIAPWSLNLIDVGGSTRATASTAASPRGVVSMRPIDAGTQEGGRSLVFAGPGTVQIAGQPVDLVRQANGEMSVAFSLRATARSAQPVWLIADGSRIDIGPLIARQPLGAWVRHKVRLSCFTPEADMRAVESPFALSVEGALEIGIADVRLASNEGDAVCPRR
jgi:beta-glucosidase